MMTLASIVFFASAGWVVFAYAGYPLAMTLFSRSAARPVRAADEFPPVSLVIAVFNGETALRAKIEASLKLEYPNAIEILVASDASTDGTDAIAREFESRGVRLVRLPERGGKESAQAAAIAQSRSDILVFTDVTAELGSQSLMKIVRPFADPEVGAVSSEDEVDSQGGEGAYVRMEMALRRMETEAGSLVGLSGSFFAIRRVLADPWPTHLASDFRSALEAARRGYRAVCEPGATAKFRAPDDASKEWQRKVRTVRRGLAVLSAYRELLSPRYGRIAFSLWGHKVARFTAPFALLTMLFANIVVALGSGLGLALLGAHLLVYALGIASHFAAPLAEIKIVRLLGFFLLVNASMLVAWRYHLFGERAVLWEPTRR